VGKSHETNGAAAGDAAVVRGWHTEKFENNRSLTQAEIDIIVAWVNAGAPKGDPKDLPPPRQFVQDGPFPSQTSYSSFPSRFYPG